MQKLKNIKCWPKWNGTTTKKMNVFTLSVMCLASEWRYITNIVVVVDFFYFFFSPSFFIQTDFRWCWMAFGESRIKYFNRLCIALSLTILSMNGVKLSEPLRVAIVSKCKFHELFPFNFVFSFIFFFLFTHFHLKFLAECNTAIYSVSWNIIFLRLFYVYRIWIHLYEARPAGESFC